MSGMDFLMLYVEIIAMSVERNMNLTMEIYF